jgi:hypothetical protein
MQSKRGARRATGPGPVFLGNSVKTTAEAINRLAEVVRQFDCFAAHAAARTAQIVTNGVGLAAKTHGDLTFTRSHSDCGRSRAWSEACFPEFVTRRVRASLLCRTWLALLRAPALEAARQFEAERLVWAETWGRKKALQAVIQFGCDLGRGRFGKVDFTNRTDPPAHR